MDVDEDQSGRHPVREQVVDRGVDGEAVRTLNDAEAEAVPLERIRGVENSLRICGGVITPRSTGRSSMSSGLSDVWRTMSLALVNENQCGTYRGAEHGR